MMTVVSTTVTPLPVGGSIVHDESKITRYKYKYNKSESVTLL